MNGTSGYFPMREQFLQLPGTSVHKRSPLAELVATYPGPHPTTDDPDTLAAHAEQVLAWLRHDHPTEWRDVLADVGRQFQTVGVCRGVTEQRGTEEGCPPGCEGSPPDLLPGPQEAP